MNKVKNDIKNLLKFFFFEIFQYTIRRKNNIGNSSFVTLVKVDELGDYILFRDTIRSIKSSKRFKNKKIRLVGNKAWEELSKLLDQNLIDDYYFIDTKKLLTSVFYRKYLIDILSSFKSETVISFHYSRIALKDDFIVRYLPAINKIGFYGNDTNSPKLLLKLTLKYYNETFKTDNKRIIFEAKRFEEYTSWILGEKITNKLNNYPEELRFRNHDVQNFIVIAPGAGALKRRWPDHKFEKLTTLILNSYNVNIILIGTKQEASELSFQKRDRVYNMIGQTDLPDLMSIINNSLLVISNESGPVHLSAMLSKKCIVISNGNHFGRFNPYPVESGIVTLYPNSVSSLGESELKKLSLNSSSPYDINEINVESIFVECEKKLQSDALLIKKGDDLC